MAHRLDGHDRWIMLWRARSVAIDSRDHVMALTTLLAMTVVIMFWPSKTLLTLKVGSRPLTGRITVAPTDGHGGGDSAGH
eukprot:gene12813-7454_t